MLIRPPYGDHAACPVSSYSTTSTFGAPSGALFERNAGQSAVESRTSSLISPWKSRGIGIAFLCWLGLVCVCVLARPPSSVRQPTDALPEDLGAEHEQDDHHDHR